MRKYKKRLCDRSELDGIAMNYCINALKYNLRRYCFVMISILLVFVGSNASAHAQGSLDKIEEFLFRHFTENYFSIDLATNRPSSNYPILKWDEPVVITVAGQQDILSAHHAEIEKLVWALNEAGLEAQLSYDLSRLDSQAVIVFFDPLKPVGLNQKALLMARMDGSRKFYKRFLAYFKSQPSCVMGGVVNKVNRFHLRSSFVAINSNQDSEQIRVCLNNNLPGIFAFRGTIKNASMRWSVFSRNPKYSYLNDWDRLAFRILSDDRLKPGLFFSDSTQDLLREIIHDKVTEWPDVEALKSKMPSSE